MKIALAVKAKHLREGDEVQTASGWRRIEFIDPAWCDTSRIKVTFAGEWETFEPNTRVVVLR